MKLYYLLVAVNACGICCNPGTLQEMLSATYTYCCKYLLHPVTVVFRALYTYHNDYVSQPPVIAGLMVCNTYCLHCIMLATFIACNIYCLHYLFIATLT
ncbi:hypothetical protein [Dysgonomonas reticulitermitis]